MFAYGILCPFYLAGPRLSEQHPPLPDLCPQRLLLSGSLPPSLPRLSARHSGPPGQNRAGQSRVATPHPAGRRRTGCAGWAHPVARHNRHSAACCEHFWTKCGEECATEGAAGEEE